MGKGSWLLGCLIATPGGGEGGGKKTSLQPSNPWPDPSLGGPLRCFFWAGNRREHHQAWSSPQLLERAWRGASYLVIAHLDRGHGGDNFIGCVQDS